MIKSKPTSNKRPVKAKPIKERKSKRLTKRLENQDDIEDSKFKGFEKGLLPEKILGASNKNGELEFLIKWRDSNDHDMVLAQVAYLKCPKLVFKFYEERLVWK